MAGSDIRNAAGTCPVGELRIAGRGKDLVGMAVDRDLGPDADDSTVGADQERGTDHPPVDFPVELFSPQTP